MKNDLIHSRIQQLANVTSFYYHMSYECYKRYVHFAKPETPSTSTVNQEQDEQDDVETSVAQNIWLPGTAVSFCRIRKTLEYPFQSLTFGCSASDNLCTPLMCAFDPFQETLPRK